MGASEARGGRHRVFNVSSQVDYSETLHLNVPSIYGTFDLWDPRIFETRFMLMSNVACDEWFECCFFLSIRRVAEASNEIKVSQARLQSHTCGLDNNCQKPAFIGWAGQNNSRYGTFY